MKLSQLLKNKPLPDLVLDCEITSITSDSRKVKQGTLFVAISGITQDGHEYIEEAFKSGAAFCLGEKKFNHKNYLQVKDARLELSELSSCFYSDPSEELLMIGVTGTSGKTTSTYLLESIMREAGYQTGVIGTIEVRYLNHKIESSHTTPDPTHLQKTLRDMKDAGVNCVIMEVSSHALVQKRAHGIYFDVALFTNLSNEHLDYHQNIDAYFDAKKILFTDLAEKSLSFGKKFKAAIENKDYGLRLSESIPSGAEINYWPEAHQAKLSLDGIEVTFDEQKIVSPLIGQFNLQNIRGAYCVAKALGIDSSVIAKAIYNLKGIPGRLEKVDDHGTGIQVYVDYAHKPDALEKVLETLLKIKKNKLFLVVGCGGDRDKEKRPVMGKIGVTHSDFVWFTSDNPRTENPVQILEEIKAGAMTSGQNNFEIIENRKNAIRAALLQAKPNDIVLIAGKGHENYQIVGSKKLDFDDRVISEEILKTK